MPIISGLSTKWAADFGEPKNRLTYADQELRVATT